MNKTLNLFAEDYTQAKRIKAELGVIVDEASAKLQTYPKGEMGLVPDEVCATIEYKTDKQAFDVANTTAKAFNRAFMRCYKKEYMQERKEKRNK